MYLLFNKIKFNIMKNLKENLEIYFDFFGISNKMKNVFNSNERIIDAYMIFGLCNRRKGDIRSELPKSAFEKYEEACLKIEEKHKKYGENLESVIVEALTPSDISLIIKISEGRNFHFGEECSFTENDVRGWVSEIAASKTKEANFFRYGLEGAKMAYVRILKKSIFEENQWFFWEDPENNLLTDYVVNGGRFSSEWTGKFYSRSCLDWAKRVYKGEEVSEYNQYLHDFVVEDITKSDFFCFKIFAESEDWEKTLFEIHSASEEQENNLFSLTVDDISDWYVYKCAGNNVIRKDNLWWLLETSHRKALTRFVKNNGKFSDVLVGRFHRVAPLEVLRYYDGSGSLGALSIPILDEERVKFLIQAIL